MTVKAPHVAAVFAHPDDESFSCGGTFALLTDRGIPVTVVSATRGDVGEISDPSLATAETLPQVREGELRSAMAAVGVSDVRFLPWRDSGMAGSHHHQHDQSLVGAPLAAVTEAVAAILRETAATLVITFGPDGIYGHPDHLRIHEATTRAAAELGIPLYYASIPRTWLQQAARMPGGPFSRMTEEQLATMGMPDDELTASVDVSRVIDRKVQALRAHRTQFGETGPMAGVPEETRMAALSTEHFAPVSGGATPELLRDLVGQGA